MREDIRAMRLINRRYRGRVVIVGEGYARYECSYPSYPIVYPSSISVSEAAQSLRAPGALYHNSNLPLPSSPSQCTLTKIDKNKKEL